MFNSGQSVPENLQGANRPYNLRMRDIYYEKAGRMLNRFRKSLKTNFLGPHIESLDNFCTSISVALDFARQAAAGHAASRPKEGSLTHQQPAVLKEEILYLNLLEELSSSGRFLKARFNTIAEMVRYRARIESLPLAEDVAKGYISRIISLLDQNRKAEEEEVRGIILLILKRIRLITHIQSITRKATHE